MKWQMSNDLICKAKEMSDIFKYKTIILKKWFDFKVMFLSVVKGMHTWKRNVKVESKITEFTNVYTLNEEIMGSRFTRDKGLLLYKTYFTIGLW